nr:MAG TPA: hypothetical protein [Caudoviricetes sp.]
MSTVIFFNLLSLPCTIIILYIRYIVNTFLTEILKYFYLDRHKKRPTKINW